MIQKKVSLLDKVSFDLTNISRVETVSYLGDELFSFFSRVTCDVDR